MGQDSNEAAIPVGRHPGGLCARRRSRRAGAAIVDPVSAAAVPASRPPPAARSPSAAMNTACPMSMPPRCTASSTATATPWPRTAVPDGNGPPRHAGQDGGSAAGPSMVAFDKSIRGNFSPERIQRQLAAMSPEDRQILDGYAAGMNAWIARVRAEPGRLMPKNSTTWNSSRRTGPPATWRWCAWAPWPTAFRCQQRDRQPGAADRIEGPARRGAGHADLQPAALDDG